MSDRRRHPTTAAGVGQGPIADPGVPSAPAPPRQTRAVGDHEVVDQRDVPRERLVEALVADCCVEAVDWHSLNWLHAAAHLSLPIPAWFRSAGDRPTPADAALTLNRLMHDLEDLAELLVHETIAVERRVYEATPADLQEAARSTAQFIVRFRGWLRRVAECADVPRTERVNPAQRAVMFDDFLVSRST